MKCSEEKSNIQSSSPDRNTYGGQFQTLRNNFDEKQEIVGAISQQTRGKSYGSNVSRIKKLFMQMGTKPSENAEGITKVRCRSSLRSFEGRTKPFEIVEKADGSVVQLETSVSEIITKFDAIPFKFTENRKGIKRNETQPFNHSSPKKEKTASADKDECFFLKSIKGTAQEDSMGSSSSKSSFGSDRGNAGAEEDEEKDSDDNSCYDHDKEDLEVGGLSEEEETPATRKIKFSTAPIKVFKTYSDIEYDRRNETIDPISSSAEYELEKRVEKLDIFPIDIEKDEQGFGISVIGMGIGIETGHEKLGIFVKTITEHGPAEKDGRIRLNDQLIEVDGVNMVGVSQDFASTVLRRSTGRIRFLIGREKAGQVSEVGKLIKQTIEYDHRQRGHHYAQYEADEDENEEETEEYGADEDNEDFGAAYPREQKNIQFFDCPENDNILSPEEIETLAEKFKELQLRHTITGTQVKQLKRKLQIAENEKISWQVERKLLQQSIKENKDNMAKIEAYWVEAQDLCHNVNGHLRESQEQYQTLERKYNKAKKLIKEFQQKELEYLQYHDADKQKIEDLEKDHFLEVQYLQARIKELETEVLRLLRQNEGQINNNNIFEQQTFAGESSKGNTAEKLDVTYLDTLLQEGAIKGVDSDDVFDFNEAVPETERLDSKALKTRLQLSVKNKRSRPIRTRLCDSISSTDGEDSLEKKNDDFSPSSTSSSDLSGLGTGSKTPGFSHSTVVSSDEILDDGQSPKHSQFPNRGVSEWSVQQVSNWLKSLNLEHYISEFTAHNINGECLLQLDGSKLKFLGMTSSQERAVIKKKIKEMKANLEKARKAQEKMEKQREKLRKKENDQFQRKCRKLEKQSPEPIQGANEQ
ncbi:neurabin-1 isoform X2 [Pantherophis guttatus]|uniref:Neurabin-1 n=1 Tax=Pantherophis guttatus TaxID=94885 RepID=A0A6P9AMR3_PANGU|nr:neurabin-1 isoform X2 [Pantherophis guttatus]